jgi:hypothetical protein
MITLKITTVGWLNQSTIKLLFRFEHFIITTCMSCMFFCGGLYLALLPRKPTFMHNDCVGRLGMCDLGCT